ncbi:hypothetical protein MHTCC0001_35270 [Flavobacteriaceae bacterium MHTCC 0001]
MKKNFYFLIFIILISTNLKAQNHKIGIKAGYTTSSASIPNNNIFIGSNGASRGNDWFNWSNGFQFGVSANIDIGYDFLHLDLAPQYSKYGFESDNKIGLDYLDFDIGASNLNSQVLSKIIGGIGMTPSFLISSKNITETNNFDLKAYIIIGYRFNQSVSVYAQARYGFIELVPDSEINNFQISFNLNVSIFKL